MGIAKFNTPELPTQIGPSWTTRNVHRRAQQMLPNGMGKFAQFAHQPRLKVCEKAYRPESGHSSSKADERPEYFEYCRVIIDLVLAMN